MSTKALDNLNRLPEAELLARLLAAPDVDDIIAHRVLAARSINDDFQSAEELEQLLQVGEKRTAAILAALDLDE